MWVWITKREDFLKQQLLRTVHWYSFIPSRHTISCSCEVYLHFISPSMFRPLLLIITLRLVENRNLRTIFGCLRETGSKNNGLHLEGQTVRQLVKKSSPFYGTWRCAVPSTYHPTYIRTLWHTILWHISTPTCFGTEGPSSDGHCNKGIQASYHNDARSNKHQTTG